MSKFQPVSLPLLYFTRGMQMLDACFKRQLAGWPVQNIAILGPSRSGKTHLLEAFARKYPPTRQKNGVLHLPVVLSRVPAHPTNRKLAGKILLDMGSPFRAGDEESRTHQIKTLFKECGTKFLLLDETNHFVERGGIKSHTSSADWMKVLGDETGVSIGLVGTEITKDLLVVNEQLRGRCGEQLHIRELDPENSDDVGNVKDILGALMRSQNFEFDSGMDKNSFARAVTFATRGLIGNIWKLVNHALWEARHIDRPLFAWTDFYHAFRRTIFPDAPDERNPFHSKFSGAKLSGIGEPFDPQAASRKVK